MEFYVGQYAEIEKRIEQRDILDFAELSGDTNPLHLQNAAGGRFSGQVCHGILVVSYISVVLGTKLPGPGTIYMSQTLSFRKPVYVGDIVTVRAQVLAVNKDKRILTIETKVVSQNVETFVEGQAMVKVQKYIKESN